MLVPQGPTPIRSIEMHNVQLITRELINEMLTPEEEREWLTHMATLPKAEMEEAREHFASSRAIYQAFVRLMDEGADPASDEVQRLLQRSNESAVRYRFRERLATRGDWNAPLARKVYALGKRLVLKTSVAEGSRSEAEIADFCAAAQKASKWGQLLDGLAREALSLCSRRESPESRAARKLAKRMQDICERHCLGDPLLFARWSIDFGKMQVGEAWVRFDDAHRAAWQLLADAVEALSKMPQSPGGSDRAASQPPGD
jgi:hypothetical protein